MSGIGKGIASASVAKILQMKGFSVTAMKIDPYLNVDAGTMNPVTHGEVFVTDDGAELDMDLGTYERFLDVNLSRDHNITTGQIYSAVIEKERLGNFLGQCVQIIPHITDEIKERVARVATATGAHIVLVEIGGTVGDIESLPFLEAARQIRLEEGYENAAFIHVTLVPVVDVVGEQKTKPTQHSVQELRRIGIQPDLILTRTAEPLQPGPRKKIALFCNVGEEAVFNAPDKASIYEIPLELDRQGFGDFLCRRLSLPNRRVDWAHWKTMLEGFVNPKNAVGIAICGKYAELADSYVSVNEALKHAAAACNSRVDISWIETEQFEEDPSAFQKLSAFDGVLVPGGFGSRGTEGKLSAIRFAREKNIPFLGICFGFQLATVELARSFGLKDANSTEIKPETSGPVIDLMPEQQAVNVKGGSMRLGSHEIQLATGTMAHKLYGTSIIKERHRHRYEVNPKYLQSLKEKGAVYSGWSDHGTRMEILEVPGHYYFLSTQFHGEFKSRPGKPSPPYFGLIKAALDRKMGKKEMELTSPIVRST